MDGKHIRQQSTRAQVMQSTKASTASTTIACTRMDVLGASTRHPPTPTRNDRRFAVTGWHSWPPVTSGGRHQARAGRRGCCRGEESRCQPQRLRPLGVLVGESLQQTQAAAHSLHCTGQQQSVTFMPAGVALSSGDVQAGTCDGSRSHEALGTYSSMLEKSKTCLDMTGYCVPRRTERRVVPSSKPLWRRRSCCSIHY